MTDNEKINDMFLRIQNFKFPTCQDQQFAQLVSEVQEGFQIMQKGILEAAQNIKSYQRAKDLEKVDAEPIEVHPGVYDIAPSQEEIKF
jgi:hypothetical protein